jgi:hypothetical protein
LVHVALITIAPELLTHAWITWAEAKFGTNTTATALNSKPKVTRKGDRVTLFLERTNVSVKQCIEPPEPLERIQRQLAASGPSNLLGRIVVS